MKRRGSGSPAPALVGECRMDPMVKIELEAAEALADLAYSGTPESVTERVKVESPLAVPPDSGFNPVESASTNTVKDSETGANLVQKNTKEMHSSMEKPMSDEQNMGRKLNLTSPTSYASSSSTRKQNLTEAEKEARKIRRILANRESARQTIRRRQAMYKELTRKAADLAWENENLKKEKELALKEYDSLRSENERLKAQILKVEEEEIRPEAKPSEMEKSTCSSTSSSFFICNQPPFYPFLWPPIIQNTNPIQLQCGTQNSIVFPSHPISSTLNPNLFSVEEGNSVMIHGGGNPVYVLPCPWLFTLPPNSNGTQTHPHSFNLNDKPNELSPSNHHIANSSSNGAVHKENSHSSESTPSINILRETQSWVPPDRGHIGSHPSRNIFMPNCVKSEALGGTLNTPQTEPQDSGVGLGKKFGDMAAAAEARKRRKQLTKLKKTCKPDSTELDNRRKKD